MGKRKTVSLNKVLTDPLYDIMDAVQKAAKTVAETTYATAGKTALAKQSKVGTTKVQTSKKQSTGKDADLKDTGKALSTAVVAGAKAAGEKMLFEGLKERKKKEEKAKTGYPEVRNARSGTVKRGVGAGGSNQWERSYSDVFKAPVTYGGTSDTSEGKVSLPKPKVVSEAAKRSPVNFNQPLSENASINYWVSRKKAEKPKEAEESKEVTYIPSGKGFEIKYANMSPFEMENEAARIAADYLTGARSDIDYDEINWLNKMSKQNAPDEVIAYHRDKAYERKNKAQQKANSQNRKTSYSPQNEGAWLKDMTESKEKKDRQKYYTSLASKYQKEASEYQDILESRGVADQYLRDATLKDVTVNSFKRGYNLRNLGRESYKDMSGQRNSYIYYDELLKSDDYNFETDNWLEKTLSGASEFLGEQFHQWTDPEAVGAGFGAAGAAILAGQAGPQAALTEELITAPVAYIAANTAFQAKSAFEVEAGLAYREMVENGISPETARVIALGVGGVNGALEALQISDLMKSFKILDASDATKPFAKKMYKWMEKRFGNAAAETAEEVAQEGATIAGVNLGGVIDKGEAVYGWKESGSRLKDTAISSFSGYALLGSAGDGIGYTYNRIRHFTPSERAYMRAGAEGLNPVDASRKAEGMEIDQESAWNAWEEGNEAYKRGEGEILSEAIDEADYLDSIGESGIMNTEYGVGELAKPYSSDLIPTEINGYIAKLPDYGSCTKVDKALDFSDISLMSRQTGTEFASVTIGDKHYLIKGDDKGTPISAEMLEEMRKYGGTLNCHSHPYVGDLKVSESDLELAKEMYWQNEFYVISPDGQYAVYNKYGIIEVRTVNRWISDDNEKFYEDLFKE